MTEFGRSIGALPLHFPTTCDIYYLLQKGDSMKTAIENESELVGKITELYASMKEFTQDAASRFPPYRHENGEGHIVIEHRREIFLSNLPGFLKEFFMKEVIYKKWFPVITTNLKKNGDVRLFLGTGSYPQGNIIRDGIVIEVNPQQINVRMTRPSHLFQHDDTIEETKALDALIRTGGEPMKIELATTILEFAKAQSTTAKRVYPPLTAV